MKIAITGLCSGAAGVLVPRLQQDPGIQEITGIDPSPWRGRREKLTFVQKDLRDASLQEHLRGADVLLHLPLVPPPDPRPAPVTLRRQRIDGAANVFQAAAVAGVPKVILLSGVAAYGHRPTTQPMVDESTPLAGEKCLFYSESRHLARVERLLTSTFADRPDVEVVRLRAGEIIGPRCGGFYISYYRWLWLAGSLNHGGRRVPCQQIHEEDLADVMMAAVREKMPGAWNVAADVVEDLSHEEFIYRNYYIRQPGSFERAIFRLLGLFNHKYTQIYPTMYALTMDTEKLKKRLDWTPRHQTLALVQYQLLGRLPGDQDRKTG